MNFYGKRYIPDYYDTMYLDGYTPQEILSAKRAEMQDMIYPENILTNIKITSEVKIK